MDDAAGRTTQNVVYATVEDPALVRYDADAGTFRPVPGGLAADGRRLLPRRPLDHLHDATPQGELWRARATGQPKRRRLTSAPLQRRAPPLLARREADRVRGQTQGTALADPHRPRRRGTDRGPGARERGAIPAGAPTAARSSSARSRAHPGPIRQWDARLRAADARARVAWPLLAAALAGRPLPGRSRPEDVRAGDPRPADGSVVAPAPRCRRLPGLDARRLLAASCVGTTAFSRIDPASGREEPVARLGGVVLAAGEWGPWSGLSPDGSPLVLIVEGPVRRCEPQRGVAVAACDSIVADERKRSR